MALNSFLTATKNALTSFINPYPSIQNLIRLAVDKVKPQTQNIQKSTLLTTPANPAPVVNPQKPTNAVLNPQPIPQVKSTTVQTPTLTTIPQISQENATGSGSSTETTPITTPVESESQKALKLAQTAYENSLKISPEELSTQEDLDKISEEISKANLAFQKGYVDAQGQPIAMPFITGQQANLQRQNALITASLSAQAEPLEKKMARLQAKRQSSLESSKYALDQAEKAITNEKSLTTPKEVSAGQSIIQYNPATGKYENIYTAPKEKEHSAIYKEYQDAISSGYTGSFIDYQNEDANRKRSVTNISVGGAEDPQVQGWVSAINAGKAKLTDVPAAYKTAVAGALSSTTAEASELQKNAYTSAQSLLADFNSGNKFAVGKSSLIPTMPGTKARNFQIAFNNLKSLLSLDNVKYLKGQGQVSDAERKLLSEASAKLDLAQSESEFKKSLQDIVDILNKAVNVSNTNAPDKMQLPNGTIVTKQPDGTYK